jgi:mono/diheme cytochrome c family protein
VKQKEFTAALTATVVALGFSLILAAQEKENSSRYKYKKDGLVYAELAKAPEKARVKRNPLEKDPDAVSAGSNLFEQHCSDCHGGAAEGTKKGPSLLEDPVQTAPPGAIYWVLTNGVVRRGMPVWSKLPEPQRWQLVAFIKSLSAPPAKPENSPAPAAQPNALTESPSPRR